MVFLTKVIPQCRNHGIYKLEHGKCNPKARVHFACGFGEKQLEL